MPWRLDKRNARYHKGGLTSSEQAKFDVFQNAIHNRGMHPKDAAKETGDTDYKNLTGDQYQIRLSQGTRVTFRVRDSLNLVEILQVGGHT